MMALRAGGCGNAAILFRHVLRNIAPSIIVMATLEIGILILHIASFSFLGLGVQGVADDVGRALRDRDRRHTHGCQHRKDDRGQPGSQLRGG